MQRGTPKHWIIQSKSDYTRERDWEDLCKLWFRRGDQLKTLGTFEEACARLMDFDHLGEGTKLRVRPKSLKNAQND